MRVRATVRLMEAGTIYDPGAEFEVLADRARQLGDLVAVVAGAEPEPGVAIVTNYDTTALGEPVADRQMRPKRRSRRKGV